MPYAVRRLEIRWASALDGVEFSVRDVPSPDPWPWEHGEVPLGRFFPAQGELPPRIVVCRRPVETRAVEPGAAGLLAHKAEAAQVAHLLGLTPGQADSRYGSDG